MVAWVWVALAALAVVALQAFLFHRARRNWGVDGEGRGHDVRQMDSLAPTDTTSGEQFEDGLRCPHCGEYNGEDFTFCGRCVQRLH